MKLFLYDEKHEAVHDELELDELDENQSNLLDKVIEFLDKSHVTNRYKRLEVAESYEVKHDDDGHAEVVFYDY